jgi:hypothetical protein
MHNEWSPGDFADTIAEIQRVTDTGVAGVGRMAGVSRSQASRWSHGKHQPAYASVRQLAFAVRRYGHRDLADKLMESAGYAALPEGDEPATAELVPSDEWEALVLRDPVLPPEMKRALIQDSRAARAAYDAARRDRRQRRDEAEGSAAAG